MTVETVTTEEKIESQDEKPGESKETEKTEKLEVTEDRIDVLAKEMGWRPKEDFQGDETDFVDAEAYIRRGQDIQDSMRKSLKDQKRQLTDMSSSIADLKSHNEKVYKVEIASLKKDLTSLRSQKKEAIEDGNVQKVNEIDEQIDTIKESMVSEKEPDPNQPPDNPEFDKWLKSNQWYLDDDEMAQYADSVASAHKGVSFKRIAKLVDKSVREIFPDKFPAQKTTTTNTTTDRVESSTRQRPSGKFTEADLTSDQKSIMKQFVRQGIMTKQAYIEDIALVAGGAR